MVRKLCLLLLSCAASTPALFAQLELRGGPLAAFLARSEIDFSQARSLPHLTQDQLLFENVLIGGNHFSLLTKWSRTSLTPLLLRSLETVKVPYASIEVPYCPIGNSCDYSDDWATVPAVFTDTEGDKDPAASAFAADLAALRIARDNHNLYFLMTLYDGYPSRNCLYVVEFQQYLNQLHTPGDMVMAVSKFGEDPWRVQILDRVTVAEIAAFGENHIGMGVGYLEWKVPISALEYPEGAPYPYYPPPGQERQGIANRFIRVLVHPQPVPGQPFPMGDTDADPLRRPMIVDFYSAP